MLFWIMLHVISLSQAIGHDLKVHWCRYENLLISSSSHKNNMPKISHCNTVYFLRYIHPRCTPQIPDCDSHSPALLDLFLSSDASICSTMAFPSLRNSDHVVVSVSIHLWVNSKRDALFHCIAYDYYRADWDGLCDHLKYVPWEDMFKLCCCSWILCVGSGCSWCIYPSL